MLAECTLLKTVCGPCAVCGTTVEPMHLVDLDLTCENCCKIHGRKATHDWGDTPKTSSAEQADLF